MPPTIEAIDSNHPLYLHPSDTPEMMLVSQLLLGLENYGVWRRLMQIALLAKNKLGLVDDSCPRSNYVAALHPQWDRCNAIVLSWILIAVSRELSAGIVFASSVASVWADLKERFNKVDGSRIFFLHREIATLSEGEFSISDYFSRLKLLWAEYETLIPFTSCECEVSQQNLKHLVRQKLFQFLMGLAESYAAVRSQILLMQPLPSVNQAYSMLLQEES
ncbi:hypothetical protein like AT1G21280 [Hibiscus trionum]|uniref:Retrotransposon Copia-like N-terminal domain-containing protein n=1 Tax=Hibiscus trionum TaxID=183268 RepID=A0A9W7HLF8_HIBTR|nr:hypothetical protein like AT1G21280 [Hibiscus trionum]